MDLFAARLVGDEIGEEGDKFGGGVPGGGLAEHLAGLDVEGRVQRERAMPEVLEAVTQSISTEDTFETDLLLADTEPMIRGLAEKAWVASCKETRPARTVVLKLKTAEFQILTRSLTPLAPPASCEELTGIALSLRERVNLAPGRRFRLIGVGLSNFRDATDEAEPPLFM